MVTDETQQRSLVLASCLCSLSCSALLHFQLHDSLFKAVEFLLSSSSDPQGCSASPPSPLVSPVSVSTKNHFDVGIQFQVNLEKEECNTGGVRDLLRNVCVSRLKELVFLSSIHPSIIPPYTPACHFLSFSFSCSSVDNKAQKTELEEKERKNDRRA